MGEQIIIGSCEQVRPGEIGQVGTDDLLRTSCGQRESALPVVPEMAAALRTFRAIYQEGFGEQTQACGIPDAGEPPVIVDSHPLPNSYRNLPA